MLQRSSVTPQQAPQAADVAARLPALGLGNAALVARLQARLQADPERARAVGTEGPARPMPHRDRLAASFAGEDLDAVPFYGGTPEAAWSAASLGTVAFAHDGAIVAASATPPVDVLAHELTHVLQGSGGAATGVAPSGSPAEREAGAAGQAAARGQAVSVEQAAPAGAVHRFPGFLPLPFDLPIPGLLEDLVREAVEEVVALAVDAVLDEVGAAAGAVRDAVCGTVADIGQGLASIAESAADAVADGLDLRQDEDVLDFEEDAASGALAVDAGAAAGLAGIIRQRRAGEDTPAEELARVRAQAAALDNDAFRALLQALDDAGLLMEVTRVAFGGEPAAGESDMFEVPVATWRFWNASDDIAADVQRANDIYEPHDIHVQAVGARTVSKAQVETIVGHAVPNTFGLDRSMADETYTNADMVAVVDALGVGQIASGLWVPTVVNDAGDQLSGTSMHTENFTHGANIAFVATDNSGPDTFAHELGHILTRDGHETGDDNNLMTGGGTRDKDAVGADRLTDAQVTNIRDDVLGYLRS
ncbi:MAG: DUF4157 domain-containing protein [Pseudomonadota bacterium]|nr:DUF4157 domain-containing protein [Pseudomonadota bacterium]